MSVGADGSREGTFFFASSSNNPFCCARVLCAGSCSFRVEAQEACRAAAQGVGQGATGGERALRARTTTPRLSFQGCTLTRRFVRPFCPVPLPTQAMLKRKEDLRKKEADIIASDPHSELARELIRKKEIREAKQIKKQKGSNIKVMR